MHYWHPWSIPECHNHTTHAHITPHDWMLRVQYISCFILITLMTKMMLMMPKPMVVALLIRTVAATERKLFVWSIWCYFVSFQECMSIIEVMEKSKTLGLLELKSRTLRPRHSSPSTSLQPWDTYLGSFFVLAAHQTLAVVAHWFCLLPFVGPSLPRTVSECQEGHSEWPFLSIYLIILTRT